MKKTFQVTGVVRRGRLYTFTLRESGVAHDAVTREVIVHRNNMPKGDAVSDGQYTRFSRPVPVLGEFDGGNASIVDGSFEEKAGAVSGAITIEVRPMATSPKSGSMDHMTPLRTT